MTALVDGLDYMERGIKVGVMAFPPQKDRNQQREVEEANTFLSKICSESYRVHFIEGGLTSIDVAEDGLHLKDVGRRKMAKAI